MESPWFYNKVRVRLGFFSHQPFLVSTFFLSFWMVRLVWFSIGQIESSVYFFLDLVFLFEVRRRATVYAESYGAIVEKISPPHLGNIKLQHLVCDWEGVRRKMGWRTLEYYVDVLRILLFPPTVSSPDMAEAFTVLVSVCYCSTGWLMTSTVIYLLGGVTYLPLQSFFLPFGILPHQEISLAHFRRNTSDANGKCLYLVATDNNSKKERQGNS